MLPHCSACRPAQNYSQAYPFPHPDLSHIPSTATHIPSIPPPHTHTHTLRLAASRISALFWDCDFKPLFLGVLLFKVVPWVIPSVLVSNRVWSASPVRPSGTVQVGVLPLGPAGKPVLQEAVPHHSPPVFISTSKRGDLTFGIKKLLGSLILRLWA